MSGMLDCIIAYIIVIYVMTYFNVDSDMYSVSAVFSNTGQGAVGDVAVCWMSAYVREHEVLTRSPDQCYRVFMGGTMRMNTYSGHRFITLPYQKSGNDDYRVVTIKKDITDYDISVKGGPESNTMNSWCEVWSMLLRYRHTVAMTIALVYFALLSLPSSNPKAITKTSCELSKGMTDIKVTRNIDYKLCLAIPRQSLKCMAVVLMLINHISYVVFKGKPNYLSMGTLPADIGGSSQIFSFLVGYNTSLNSTRASTQVLIVVFMLMEHFIRLPEPFVYEYLFTFAVARGLLSLRALAVDTHSLGPTCKFASYPAVVHAIAICVLVMSNSLVNAEGLRFLQNIGLLFALTGRMFVTCRRAEIRFLWALSSAIFLGQRAWSKLSSLDTSSTIELLVAVICVGGLCLETLLFTFPVSSEQQWWQPSRLAKLISRYSLEIYVGHLVLLYIYMQAAGK